MPDIGTTNGTDFSARLRAALQGAKSAAGDRSVLPAGASGGDEFAERLKAAAEAARQTRKTPDTEREQADLAPPQLDRGPVGHGEYKVKPGDSIESIAYETGHFHETIWNDPGNAELREARTDHNILLPGDGVTIPPKTRKQETLAPEQRHRFRRRGVPAHVSFQLLYGDEPLANRDYTLTVDDLRFTGITDPDGKLEAPVPPNARRAIVVVGEDEHRFEFALGELHPITESIGVQRRLANLGHDCPVTGEWCEASKRALMYFQARMGLAASGERDDETIAQLEALHDFESRYPPRGETLDTGDATG